MHYTNWKFINDGWWKVLEQGDTVRVVWTASSGGTTQTLFNYEVQ